MLIRILRTFESGPQTLNAGVLCAPADELARDWIALGLAEAVDGGGREDAPATSNPVLDGMLDVPPAKPRRKATG
jgi:hypothetical protein